MTPSRLCVLIQSFLNIGARRSERFRFTYLRATCPFLFRWYAQSWDGRTLPTSKKFRAKGTRDPASLEFEEFETCLLDDAIAEMIDEQLEVVLRTAGGCGVSKSFPAICPLVAMGPARCDSLRLH